MLFNMTIDLRTAATLLRAVVEDFGRDHKAVNPAGDDTSGCIYAVVQNYALVPVCIVGQVIARLGLLRLLLLDGDQNEPLTEYQPSQMGACFTTGSLWDRLAEAGVEFTPDARVLLDAAQQKQDGRHDPSDGSGSNAQPWGAALDYALNEVQSIVHRAADEAASVAREKVLNRLSGL